MYRTYGLLKADTDFDLDAATARLKQQFPTYLVTRTGDQITITKGDWEMEMALVVGPHVRTESQGIADRIAGLEPDEAESLAACDRRVEVWSETPDPFLEHFGEYGSVIEVLKTFRGLVAVDPHGSTLT